MVLLDVKIHHIETIKTKINYILKKVVEQGHIHKFDNV